MSDIRAVLSVSLMSFDTCDILSKLAYKNFEIVIDPKILPLGSYIEILAIKGDIRFSVSGTDLHSAARELKRVVDVFIYNEGGEL